MKLIANRRIRRRTINNDIAVPKKDNQHEQQFFGETAHEPFFKPLGATQQHVQRKCTDCENEDKVQRSAEKKEEEKVMKKEEKKEEKVQRVTDKKEEDKKVQKKGDKKEEERVMKKEEKKEEEKIHKKENKKEEEKVYKKEGTASTANTGTATSNYIGLINGKGQNMDAGVQSFYESRIGADFSDVKIHTGKEAAESAKDINAQAYAYGNHIVFNEGKYQPETSEGKHLLAHELAHVVQQKNETIQRDDVKAAVPRLSKKEELIAKIKTNYGISAVIDGDAAFTWEELDLVNMAFAKIPAADIVSINGAVLKRIKNGGPTVAAFYQNRQQFDDKSVIDEQSVTITDEAFTSAKPGETVQKIIHEVGHAISKIEVIKKTREAHKAGFESNQAIIKVLEKKKIVEGLPADTDEKVKSEHAAELTALRADRDIKMKDSASKDSDMTAAYANVDDFKASAHSSKLICESEDSKVTTIFNDGDANSASYKTTIKYLQASLIKFYGDNILADSNNDKITSDKESIETKITDRNQKRTALLKSDSKNSALAAMSPLSGAQDSFFKNASLFAYNKQMAKPIRKFYDFVLANSIMPTDLFSSYAKKEWPNKPGEFYAEAYSFFITDSQKLKTFSIKLFDWFSAGNYK